MNRVLETTKEGRKKRGNAAYIIIIIYRFPSPLFFPLHDLFYMHSSIAFISLAVYSFLFILQATSSKYFHLEPSRWGIRDNHRAQKKKWKRERNTCKIMQSRYIFFPCFSSRLVWRPRNHSRTIMMMKDGHAALSYIHLSFHINTIHFFFVDFSFIYLFFIIIY